MFTIEKRIEELNKRLAPFRAAWAKADEKEREAILVTIAPIRSEKEILEQTLKVRRRREKQERDTQKLDDIILHASLDKPAL